MTLNPTLVDRLARLSLPVARTAPITPNRMYYTRGERLIEPRVIRSNFADQLYRSLGGQTALDPVTLSYALGTSVEAFACSNYRASTTSTIPLNVVNADGVVDETPLVYFLREQALTVIFSLTQSILVWGYGYLRKQYNPDGFPTGLTWLNPTDVREVPDYQRGVVAYYDVRDPLTFRTERVETRDIIYFQDFDSRSGGTGLSRFEVSFLDINIIKGQATYSAGFFINGAQPDGVLVYEGEGDPDQDDVNMVASAWREQMKGAANAHRTIVLPGSWKWVAMNAPPKDLAMPELAKQASDRIHQAFEVHPALTGSGDVSDPLSANSTFGSLEVAHIRTVTLSFIKRIVLAELNRQWVRPDFGGSYWLAVDEKNIPALAEANLAKSTTTLALNNAVVIDYNESRELVGFDARAQDEYFVRNPAEALSAWMQGAITYNQLQKYTRGIVSDLPEGDVLLIQGSIIPRSRLLELANANVDRMKAPVLFSPFGAPTPPTPPPPATPPPVVPFNPPAGTTAERDTGDALFVALDLVNNPDLISLQRDLEGRYPAVDWNDPADFHVTLLYAPVCDPAKAQAFADGLAALPLPDLNLRLGSLNSFDNVGEHAIHFRIRENAALREYQADLYQLAVDCGIALSSYSTPGMTYKPHVTMGYAKEKTRVTWATALTVTPLGLLAKHGDAALLEADAGLEQPALRSAVNAAYIVSFARNSFIRAACRGLDAYFRSRGWNNPAWVGETAWTLELGLLDKWTPSLLAKLVQSRVFADTGKIELKTAGFVENSGSVYLTFEPNDYLTALIRSCALDAENVGCEVFAPPVLGIPLCTFGGDTDTGDIDLAAAPRFVRPLVVDKVLLERGSIVERTWALRGLTPEQDEELEWWAKFAKKDRTRAFTVRSCPPIIGEFIRLSLEDTDADTSAVFEAARDWLVRSYSETRSYEDTRTAFVGILSDLFKQAATEDVTRGKFAAQLRANLRKFGLMAFRDGMNSEQYDPESFSTKELAVFRKWQSDASERVTAVGAEIYRGGGITEGEAAIRADMWANVTLRQIFYEGAALAAADKLKIWRVTPGKDSCRTCLSRNGVTLPYSKWKEIGLPGDFNALECRGLFCECFFEDPPAGARSADFETVRSTLVHQHDHNEDTHDQSQSDPRLETVPEHSGSGESSADAHEERYEDRRAAGTSNLDETLAAGDQTADASVHLESRSDQTVESAALVVQGDTGEGSADSERALRSDGVTHQELETDQRL